MEHPDDCRQSLLLAKAGDEIALGRLLELYRPLLRERVRAQIHGQLQRRLDESDLVQQTFLRAFRDFKQFRGDTPEEFAGWLLQIHERILVDVIRRHQVAQKRAADREVRGSEALRVAPGRATSPSQRAIRGESRARLEMAIRELPEAQQEAVRLRYLESRSIAEIAGTMERSEESVAGLLKRGLAALRRFLADPDVSTT
jgi:RNA polymerase sigma-70 factor, ECF subfamily